MKSFNILIANRTVKWNHADNSKRWFENIKKEKKKEVATKENDHTYISYSLTTNSYLLIPLPSRLFLPYWELFRFPKLGNVQVMANFTNVTKIYKPGLFRCFSSFNIVPFIWWRSKTVICNLLLAPRMKSFTNLISSAKLLLFRGIIVQIVMSAFGNLVFSRVTFSSIIVEIWILSLFELFSA